MEGKVEAISKERYGLKIGGRWFNAKQDNVKEFFEFIEKGDVVEFVNDGNELVFIKKVEKARPEAKAEAKAEASLKEKMKEIIEDTQEMYFSENIKEEFRDKIDWTKVILTLFITETR